MSDSLNERREQLQHVNPESGFDPRPLGFSAAVITPPNARFVFVSGQLDAAPNAPFDQQVRGSFRQLEQVLIEAGASLGTVVVITNLVVGLDSERLATLSRARRKLFGDRGPTSTTHGVHCLASPHALFEVNALAVTLKANG